MLTVANGLESVPSPLKWMPSTMAFGCATPPTMLYPCVANRYRPRRVRTPQVFPSSWARAVPKVPKVIAAATRLTNAHPKSEEPITGFINLVLIVVSSFLLVLMFSFFSFHHCFDGSVGFSGKSFFSNGAEKLALFPCCILSAFVRFLYLPSSVYTRIGSAEFQQSRKNFCDTSVHYHQQTECFAGNSSRLCWHRFKQFGRRLPIFLMCGSPRSSSSL